MEFEMYNKAITRLKAFMDDVPENLSLSLELFDESMEDCDELNNEWLNKYGYQVHHPMQDAAKLLHSANKRRG